MTCVTMLAIYHYVVISIIDIVEIIEIIVTEIIFTKSHGSLFRFVF